MSAQFHSTHRTFYTNDGTRTCAVCLACACHMPDTVEASCVAEVRSTDTTERGEW